MTARTPYLVAHVLATLALLACVAHLHRACAAQRALAPHPAHSRWAYYGGAR